MPKFSFDNPAKLRILSAAEISSTHEQALQLLENTGVRFALAEALKFLAGQGCAVDWENMLACFSLSTVYMITKRRTPVISSIIMGLGFLVMGMTVKLTLMGTGCSFNALIGLPSLPTA